MNGVDGELNLDFDFLNEHFVPSSAPSLLDTPEWAATRDFLLASPSPSENSSAGGWSSFDPSLFPSSFEIDKMSAYSSDSAFDPCASWPAGNGTPFGERFSSVVGSNPVFAACGGGDGENRDLVSVCNMTASSAAMAPLWAADASPVAPDLSPASGTLDPMVLSAGTMVCATSPSAQSSPSLASVDSEWAPSRRLQESVRNITPKKCAPRSSKAGTTGGVPKTTYYRKRKHDEIKSHGTQLFGDDMCINCQKSPAKLDCIHQPGEPCLPCMRNRKSTCSLVRRVQVRDDSATPTPMVVDAMETFQHAFTMQPSRGTMAGTQHALAELKDDLIAVQVHVAGILRRLDGVLDSISSSSF